MSWKLCTACLPQVSERHGLTSQFPFFVLRLIEMWHRWIAALLLTAVGADAACKIRESVSSASSGRFPFQSVSGDITLEQLDTIMSLVSIPENSRVEWWTNYDYCEDINDDRGFTVSLVGFCSGTSDLLGVVRDVAMAKPSHPIAQFVKPLEAVDGTPSHNGLGSLCSTIHSNNDDTWKNAVWNGIRREYWDPATEWAAKHGLTSALSKGFLFDVALNHGTEVIDELAKKTGKDPKTVGEKAFMMEFMNARAAVITSGDDTTNSGQTDRVDLWKSILQKDNMQLKRPLKDLKCYGDTFEITG